MFVWIWIPKRTESGHSTARLDMMEMRINKRKLFSVTNPLLKVVERVGLSVMYACVRLDVDGCIWCTSPRIAPNWSAIAVIHTCVWPHRTSELWQLSKL